MMPATPVWRLIQVSNACAMAATDVPRSPVKRPAAPRGWLSATSIGGTSAPEGLPLVERSTRRVRRPASLRRSRIKRSSSPLVSSVPATTTKGSLAAVDDRGGTALRHLGDAAHGGRGGAGLRLDLRRRHRLRPARRQLRVGHVDARGAGRRRCRPARARRLPRSAPAAGVSSWPWRPTPSRRSCSSRSAASSRESISRLMRPLTMMATVSATSVATPIFCSITSTAISPSSARRTRMSSTWATMTGARPSVGSSITSRRGLSSSAREIASICCSPPESCEPALDLRSASRGKVS